MKFTVFAFILVFVAACGRESKLTVATSANMEFAIKKIAEAFEKEKGIKTDVIVSSSGTLTNQIIQGAPFDVFVAANMKYPQNLYEKGLTENLPKTYAYGNMVLWTLNEFTPSVQILLSDSISKIAVTNPKTGPYGELAIAFLKKQGVYTKIKHKLVYGKSVSQTNQFIVTNAVDLGFTSLSTVQSEQMQKTGQWINIDKKTTIAQGIVQMKNGQNKKKATSFYDFMFGKKAQLILTENGYKLPLND